MKFRARIALVTLLVGIAGMVATAAPGRASACSCALIDPVDAIAHAEIVFTGTVLGNEGDDDRPRWRFSVDGVVKGDVGPHVTVSGDDWAAGCGTNFEWYEGSIAVYAGRRGDELTAIGCMPTPSSDELAAAIEDFQRAPSGVAPPAFVMIGQVGTTNIALLDDQGRTIVRADLGTGLNTHAVAHCVGTSRAATFVDDGELDVVIVDLDDLTVVERRPTTVGHWVGGDSSIVCLDGGDRVIVSAGHGPNAGSVRWFTSNAAGLGVTDVDEQRTDIVRGIVHPAGPFIALPWVVGGRVTAHSPTDLAELPGSGTPLPGGAAAVDGALSPDGTQLAILVTFAGVPADYDTRGTHVVTMDVVEGVPVDGTATTVALVDPGPAHTIPGTVAPSMPAGPLRIAWADATTLALEHESWSSKLIEFIRTDGEQLLPATDIGWGWRMIPAEDGIVRVGRGGVEVISFDGTSTPGDPGSRPDSLIDRNLWLDRIVVERAPVAPDVAPADVLSIRPPSPTADETPSASAATTGTSDGTLAVVAGLVALGLALAGSLVWRRRHP